MSSASLRNLFHSFPAKGNFLRRTFKRNTVCSKTRALDFDLRTPGFTRRHFLRFFATLPFLSFLPSPFPIRGVQAETVGRSPGETGKSISEFFRNEELFYDIGFWLFNRAAQGTLHFKESEKKGRYVATLRTETLGVLGWMARYRVDTYRATMEEVDGGRRLRSLSFEEDVKVGQKSRKKIHHFDYPNQKWIQLRQRKNGTMERGEEGIPPGRVYDDFLTASYNFRFGVYGPMERGRRYTVTTFPRKGAASYEVSIAPGEEEEKRRRAEKVKDGKDFLVRLSLDPQITHSKEGMIEGWLSKESLPIEGTIKDVVLFGDVKGTLVKKN
jgi:hypothetical protein